MLNFFLVDSGKGWRHKPRLFMIVTCAILYFMSLWHWATTVHNIFALGSELSGMVSGGMDCTNTLVSAPTCSPSLEQMILNYNNDGFLSAPSRVCVTTTPLLISVSAMHSRGEKREALISTRDRLSLATRWCCGGHWSYGRGIESYRAYQRC